MTKSEAREWRRQKQREYQRRYNQSEKGKARMERYSGTEKSKERYARYQHSEKGRETMRRYDASDKRKVVALKVRRTDRYAERHQVYRDERRNNIIEAINDWYSHRTTIEDLQDLVGRELRPEEIDWWWIVVHTDADRFLKLREKHESVSISQIFIPGRQCGTRHGLGRGCHPTCWVCRGGSHADFGRVIRCR